MNNFADWPDSLKEYVIQAFAKYTRDVDKDRVEIILKGKVALLRVHSLTLSCAGKLTRAYNEGTVWTKDWSKEEPIVLNGCPDLASGSSVSASPVKAVGPGVAAAQVAGGPKQFTTVNHGIGYGTSSSDSFGGSYARKQYSHAPNDVYGGSRRSTRRRSSSSSSSSESSSSSSRSRSPREYSKRKRDSSR